MASWERIIFQVAKEAYRESQMTESELAEKRRDTMEECLSCLMCIGCIGSIIFFL